MVHVKEGVSDAVKALELVYESQSGADVTFKLTDGEIRAHKWYLSARLPYFRAMFESGMIEARTNVVEINCDCATFDGFLRFLYCGQSPPGLGEMPMNEALFELASRYGVDKLSQLCLETLVRTMKLDNSVDEWLKEAKNVFQVIDKRLESLPKSWARRIAGGLREDCGQELEQRLYLERKRINEGYMRDDNVNGTTFEEYANSFSGLDSAPAYEHVDLVVTSILKACDQYDWAREFLLPRAFSWVRSVLGPDGWAGNFPMTDALGVIKDRVGIFLSFYEDYEDYKRFKEM